MTTTLETLFNEHIKTTDRRRNDFSPEKNLQAYKLSTMDRKTRGTICEKVVCDILQDNGWQDVEHIGGTYHYDISTSEGSVECKSAMITSNGNYLFQAVKTEFFSHLALIAIHPENITIKMIDSKTADRMTNNQNAISITPKCFDSLPDIHTI